MSSDWRERTRGKRCKEGEERIRDGVKWEARYDGGIWMVGGGRKNVAEEYGKGTWREIEVKETCRGVERLRSARRHSFKSRGSGES